MWVRDVPGWENGDPSRRVMGPVAVRIFEILFAAGLVISTLTFLGFVLWFVGMFVYLLFFVG